MDKVSETSPATSLSSSSSAFARPSSNATNDNDEAHALIKSFRRKKFVRARLLPIESDAASSPTTTPTSPRPRPLRPPPSASSSSTSSTTTARAASPAKRAILDRLLPEDDGGRGWGDNNNDTDDDDGDRAEPSPSSPPIARLQQVHALLTSAEEIARWIAAYETERTRFTSFALFTESRLDDLQERYVPLAGRPNGVEAAACCATLLKMPGIVGCYRTLLEKVARGLESVVYLPEDGTTSSSSPLRLLPDEPLGALVRGYHARKPYFERVWELERQLRNARSLTDPEVLGALTADEVTELASHVPFPALTTGVISALARHLTQLDQFLEALIVRRRELHLGAYGGGRRAIRRLESGGGSRGRPGTGVLAFLDDGDAYDPDDPEYPFRVPLASSAQICRAITQHALGFSSSGKEMILCSILEFIDIESFKDVFKRFDAHGKTCFLHHLSVYESSEHLQAILEHLPSAGDTLFRFYYVICGGGGSGKLDEKAAKNTFFQKVLSAEMEFFFLCDLAAYLNEEQWQLLSQEYEKHAEVRKARRRRRRRQLLRGAGDDNDLGDDADDDDGDGEDDGDADDDGDGGGDARKPGAAAGSASSLENFQVLIWNYLHHHKFTSPQVLSLLQAVLLPSLEEKEALACVDGCLEPLPIESRWRKLLGLVEEMEADSGSGLDTEHEAVRHVRFKMLKRLFAMLTREERGTWMDKIVAKYGLLTNKPAPPPPRKTVLDTGPSPMIPTTPTVVARPKLDEPRPLIATMRMDLKMLWLEALLEALTTDKEASARHVLLKQALVPFLQGPGATAAVVTASANDEKAPELSSPPPPAHATVVIRKLTLDEAEKTILGVVQRLSESEAAALWRRVLPEHLRPKPPVAKSDRGTSPMSPMPSTERQPVASPSPLVPTAPAASNAWWATLTPDSDIGAAFQSLLASRSQADVLRILRKGLPKNGGDGTSDDNNNDDDDDDDAGDADGFDANGGLHGSASFKDTLKRKVSAVVAVAQPMDWQERVPVGMTSVATQTFFSSEADDDPMVPVESVPVRAPLTLATLLGRPGAGNGGGGGGGGGGGAGGSPKKKDAKYQKLNSAAVPRAISGLITSWRVNTEQLIQFAKKTMPTVLRLIGDAYGEMLTAGRRRANYQAANGAGSAAAVGNNRNKDLTLAQIVYQQFLHSYGLPNIADMHLLAFSCALENYRAQHLRVELFARFVFEEAPKSELTNFLEFLECLVCEDTLGGGSGGGGGGSGSGGGGGNGNGSNGGASTSTSNSSSSSSNSNNNGSNSSGVTTKRQRFVPRIVVTDKENWMVPLERAQEAAQLCFRAMRKQAVMAFCDKLVALAAKGTTFTTTVSGANAPAPSGAAAASSTTTSGNPEAGRQSPGLALSSPTPPTAGDTKGSEGLCINADFLMQLVVEEWREEQLRREGHLLNVFRAGDVNGDGQLTSAEFSQIVLAIDHTRDLGDILLMYSDTVRRTDCESINADVFLQVAKEYELDRAAWNEDGDLRNIVNDFSELQCTWLETRPYFVGTLEALARDLPTLHFLRVCEGAGCGCLRCILDGYIGFQRMRREFLTTSNPRNAIAQALRSTGGAGKRVVVSEALLWARFWHLMRQLYEAAAESPGILTPWEGADYIRIEAAPRPPPRYLKYRRNALPIYLFPDPVRISGMLSASQNPEVFDKAEIETQFVNLLQLMTYTTSQQSALNSSDGT